jgi:hypothetical protein
VTFLGRLERVGSIPRNVCRVRLRKGLCNAGVQRGLILLHGQYVVRILVDHRGGRFGLTMHSIQRHDAPVQRQLFQQRRHGRDDD